MFSDLKSRVIAAMILAVVSFTAMWLGGGVFALFVAIAAGVMLFEFTRLVQADCDLQQFPAAILIVIGAVSVFAMVFAPVWFLIIASLGLIGAAILNPRIFGKLTAGGYAYIVLAAGAAVYLRELEGGALLLLWLVLCVIMADIGGYAFGRRFGGPKLAPRISPKKTWSGYLGGVLLALVVTLVFSMITEGRTGYLMLLAVPVATLSVLGDILESAVKRKFGVKDAGRILPGHGGLLDRLDGMAAVVLFFGFLSLVFDLPSMLGLMHSADGGMR